MGLPKQRFDRGGSPLPPQNERTIMELDPTIEPWEQQPGEKDRNYGYFMMFRDLGRTRSLRQASEITGRAINYLRVLQSTNKWVARADAWDTEQDRLFSARVVDQRKDMATRHLKAAQQLMGKALARLQTLEVERISPHALVLFIDTAAKIERWALGVEPTHETTRVAATVTTGTDVNGQPQTRVEVGVMHEQVMSGLADLVKRMSPEQIAAGMAELTAEASVVADELDAALSATPPP